MRALVGISIPAIRIGIRPCCFNIFTIFRALTGFIILPVLPIYCARWFVHITIRIDFRTFRYGHFYHSRPTGSSDFTNFTALAHLPALPFFPSVSFSPLRVLTFLPFPRPFRFAPFLHIFTNFAKLTRTKSITRRHRKGRVTRMTRMGGISLIALVS